MDNICYYTFLPFNDKKSVSNAGITLVKLKFQEILGENADLTLAHNKNGKPYLKLFPDFHFNISHSDNILAVAFSSAPVGIDVEKNREINLKISQRYFCEEEKNFVTDVDSFFYVWTRKEASAKHKGECLGSSLTEFNSLSSEQIKTHKINGFTVSICSDTDKAFKISRI